MKTIPLIILLLTLLQGAMAQQESGATVTVTLENIQNDQGDILASLHTQTTFMKGQGLENLKSEARQGRLTLVFENVQPGNYAVLVLHDLNRNQQMDYDTGGIPLEPYAMSGTDMQMGPPNFYNCDFEVGSEDLDLKIRF